MLSWNNPIFKKQPVLKKRPVHLGIDNVTVFDGTGSDSYENGRILIKNGMRLVFLDRGKKQISS